MDYDPDMDQPELNGFAEDEQELIKAIDKIMIEKQPHFDKLAKL
ncbi:hypothetical protein [Nitrosopumilus sp.]